MRSEFEKWYRDKYQVTKQLYFFEDTQRYEDGFAQDAWEVWQHRQTELDELQKKNAWLSDVACRENKRANKLQEENVSTTFLLGKTIQEKNELQKRIDGIKKIICEAYESNGNSSVEIVFDEIEHLEQALKGGFDE